MRLLSINEEPKVGDEVFAKVSTQYITAFKKYTVEKFEKFRTSIIHIKDDKGIDRKIPLNYFGIKDLETIEFVKHETL